MTTTVVQLKLTLDKIRMGDRVYTGADNMYVGRINCMCVPEWMPVVSAEGDTVTVAHRCGEGNKVLPPRGFYSVERPHAIDLDDTVTRGNLAATGYELDYNPRCGWFVKDGPTCGGCSQIAMPGEDHTACGKPAYTDCPDCGETDSVLPPIARPALVLNPGASDEATLSDAGLVSSCLACNAVVHVT